MTITNRGKNFIFVGGVPRSGTTLVQNILDSHTDIFGLPEFFFLPEVIRVRDKMHFDIDHGMTDVICSKSDVDNYLCTFIENFLFPMIKKYKCGLLSEKTPHNVLVFPNLAELLPAARFIHVVRDPRAVISYLFEVRKRSQKKEKKYPGHMAGVRDAIKFNCKCLQKGFEASAKHPDKILTVVYEKLVKDPEFETKKICQFLNIPWQESMMYPGRLTHLGEGAITSAHNSAYYTKEMFNRNPETGSLEKWKELLTSDEQIRIARAFEGDQNLSKLGYDFSLSYLPAVERLKGECVANFRGTIGDIKLNLVKALSQ